MSNIIMTPTSEVIVPEIVTSAIDRDFPSPNVSTRYHHLTTSQVVDALAGSGWEVTKKAEARVRDASRRGFQKHFVWMRQAKIDLAVGDTELRVLLVNAHDGTCAYRMMAGLHRKVCSNGLIVSIGEFAAISIRHTDDEIFDKAIAGANQIAALAPAIDANIKRMQTVELTQEQQRQLAAQTVRLVWPDKSITYVNPDDLLQARRASDGGDSLWNVYNRIQENVIRGGVANERGRSTRAVQSPIRDMQINRELFALAATFA